MSLRVLLVVVIFLSISATGLQYILHDLYRTHSVFGQSFSVELSFFINTSKPIELLITHCVFTGQTSGIKLYSSSALGGGAILTTGSIVIRKNTFRNVALAVFADSLTLASSCAFTLQQNLQLPVLAPPKFNQYFLEVSRVIFLSNSSLEIVENNITTYQHSTGLAWHEIVPSCVRVQNSMFSTGSSLIVKANNCSNTVPLQFDYIASFAFIRAVLCNMLWESNRITTTSNSALASIYFYAATTAHASLVRVAHNTFIATANSNDAHGFFYHTNSPTNDVERVEVINNTIVATAPGANAYGFRFYANSGLHNLSHWLFSSNNVTVISGSWTACVSFQTFSPFRNISGVVFELNNFFARGKGSNIYSILNSASSGCHDLGSLVFSRNTFRTSCEGFFAVSISFQDKSGFVNVASVVYDQNHIVTTGTSNVLSIYHHSFSGMTNVGSVIFNSNFIETAVLYPNTQRVAYGITYSVQSDLYNVSLLLFQGNTFVTVAKEYANSILYHRLSLIHSTVIVYSQNNMTNAGESETNAVEIFRADGPSTVDQASVWQYYRCNTVNGSTAGYLAPPHAGNGVLLSCGTCNVTLDCHPGHATSVLFGSTSKRCECQCIDRIPTTGPQCTPLVPTGITGTNSGTKSDSNTELIFVMNETHPAAAMADLMVPSDSDLEVRVQQRLLAMTNSPLPDALCANAVVQNCVFEGRSRLLFRFEAATSPDGTAFTTSSNDSSNWAAVVIRIINCTFNLGGIQFLGGDLFGFVPKFQLQLVNNSRIVVVADSSPVDPFLLISRCRFQGENSVLSLSNNTVQVQLLSGSFSGTSWESPFTSAVSLVQVNFTSGARLSFYKNLFNVSVLNGNFTAVISTVSSLLGNMIWRENQIFAEGTSNVASILFYKTATENATSVQYFKNTITTIALDRLAYSIIYYVMSHHAVVHSVVYMENTIFSLAGTQGVYSIVYSEFSGFFNITSVIFTGNKIFTEAKVRSARSIQFTLSEFQQLDTLLFSRNTITSVSQEYVYTIVFSLRSWLSRIRRVAFQSNVFNTTSSLEAYTIIYSTNVSLNFIDTIEYIDNDMYTMASTKFAKGILHYNNSGVRNVGKVLYSGNKILVETNSYGFGVMYSLSSSFESVGVVLYQHNNFTVSALSSFAYAIRHDRNSGFYNVNNVVYLENVISTSTMIRAGARDVSSIFYFTSSGFMRVHSVLYASNTIMTSVGDYNACGVLHEDNSGLDSIDSVIYRSNRITTTAAGQYGSYSIISLSQSNIVNVSLLLYVSNTIENRGKEFVNNFLFSSVKLRQISATVYSHNTLTYSQVKDSKALEFEWTAGGGVATVETSVRQYYRCNTVNGAESKLLAPSRIGNGVELSACNTSCNATLDCHPGGASSAVFNNTSNMCECACIDATRFTGAQCTPLIANFAPSPSEPSTSPQLHDMDELSMIATIKFSCEEEEATKEPSTTAAPSSTTPATAEPPLVPLTSIPIPESTTAVPAAEETTSPKPNVTDRPLFFSSSAAPFSKNTSAEPDNITAAVVNESTSREQSQPALVQLGISPEVVEAALGFTYTTTAIGALVSPTAGTKGSTAGRMTTLLQCNVFSHDDPEEDWPEEPAFLFMVFPVGPGSNAPIGSVEHRLSKGAGAVIAVALVGTLTGLSYCWIVKKYANIAVAVSGKETGHKKAANDVSVAQSLLLVWLMFLGPSAVEVGVTGLRFGGWWLMIVLGLAPNLFTLFCFCWWILRSFNTAWAKDILKKTNDGDEGESVEGIVTVSMESERRNATMHLVLKVLWDSAGDVEHWLKRAVIIEDLLASNLIALAVGIRPSSHSGCMTVGVVICVIAALHCAYLAIVRPYEVKFDAVTSVVLGGLQLCLGIAIVAALATGNRVAIQAVAISQLGVDFGAIVVVFVAAVIAVRQHFNKNKKQGKLSSIVLDSDSDNDAAAPLLITPSAVSSNPLNKTDS